MQTDYKIYHYSEYVKQLIDIRSKIFFRRMYNIRINLPSTFIAT